MRRGWPGLRPGAAKQGRFQFTGQIWLAEVGLYHYKARLYDPWLGRFLQTDPIGYEDQQNWYAYVGNDPVNLVDPTGMWALYFSGQLQVQYGGVGGRISISIGVDTERKSVFGIAALGGQDPFSPASPEAMGLQAGVGGGVGFSPEGLSFLETPAYVTDVDVGLGSATVATNEPLIGGMELIGNPLSDGGRSNGERILGPDTLGRSVEGSIGIGLGGSQTLMTPVFVGEFSLEDAKNVIDARYNDDDDK